METNEKCQLIEVPLIDDRIKDSVGAASNSILNWKKSIWKSQYVRNYEAVGAGQNSR